jgi:hypothetical protein
MIHPELIEAREKVGTIAAVQRCVARLELAMEASDKAMLRPALAEADRLQIDALSKQSTIFDAPHAAVQAARDKLARLGAFKQQVWPL